MCLRLFDEKELSVVIIVFGKLDEAGFLLTTSVGFLHVFIGDPATAAKNDDE